MNETGGDPIEESSTALRLGSYCRVKIRAVIVDSAPSALRLARRSEFVVVVLFRAVLLVFIQLRKDKDTMETKSDVTAALLLEVDRTDVCMYLRGYVSLSLRLPLHLTLFDYASPCIYTSTEDATGTESRNQLMSSSGPHQGVSCGFSSFCTKPRSGFHDVRT
eukprot:scaffold4358_cov156-Amphora_coffeaeformis.AAC.1